MLLLLYKPCRFTGVSRDIDIREVEFYLIEDATAAIYCSLRGFSEEAMAAGGTRHTVDADPQT